MSIHGHVCVTRTLYFNGHPLKNSPVRSGHAWTVSTTTRRAAVGSNYVDVPNSFSDGAWSGWGADRYHCKVSSCPKLTATEGYWNIPTAFYDGRTNDSMTAWYGIGGYENTDSTCGDGVGPGLVQAGTMSWHQGGAFNQFYDMWMENTASSVNCDQIEIGLAVNVGDRMYAVIGGAASSTAAAIYIADQTLGVAYQTIHGPYSNWPNPDQNTAECIVERNHWLGSPLEPVMNNMTDFGNVYFNYCRATTNYTTETGIGSVANMVPDHFWYYYLSGGELPCVTVDDFDSSSNWSYYAVSNESTYPQC